VILTGSLMTPTWPEIHKASAAGGVEQAECSLQNIAEEIKPLPNAAQNCAPRQLASCLGRPGYFLDLLSLTLPRWRFRGG